MPLFFSQISVTMWIQPSWQCLSGVWHHLHLLLLMLEEDWRWYMKNKTFFHIIYIIFLWNFLCLFFFSLGPWSVFSFVVLSYLTCRGRQRPYGGCCWDSSLHTYTVGSALMTVYYFALQEKYLVEERRRSKWGRKESFQRASNRANINVINNSNNSLGAHAHTHGHTYTVLYILASLLEPLSLEDASNPNILAIEEDISIKNLKMEHLISMNV